MSELQRYVERFTAQLEVQTAAEAGGEFRIKGIANTFRPMRSGRVILPGAVGNWLAAQGEGGVDLPLLANHGGVSGLATIGRVDRMEAGKDGLRFEAVIASGTALADEARALLAQKMLRCVSLGWTSSQDRMVRIDDADIDPDLQRVMKRHKLGHVWAFFEVQPVELSIVDVPDDGGAKIRSGLMGVELAAPMELRVADFTAPISEAVQAAFQARWDAFAERMRADIIEMIETYSAGRQADCGGYQFGSGPADPDADGECPVHGDAEGGAEESESADVGLTAMLSRLRAC